MDDKIYYMDIRGKRQEDKILFSLFNIGNIFKIDNIK